MSQSRFRTFVLSSSAVVALATGGPAFAQAASSDAAARQAPEAFEGELIVTARRQNESLKDAPLSISAFTSEQIKAAGISDIRNLSGLAPGLTIVDAGGNGAGGRAFGQIYIRPLPPTLPLPRTQTGALFVDGIYVMGSASSVDTSDVERIEVIKGPQSALFGRNTFGGAINFVTRRPGNEFAGSVDASGSLRGSYRLSASVEGPLVEDKLSARLTGTLYRKGAQYTANDGGKLGEESSKSLALTLSATPTDGLTLRARGTYQRDLDGPSQETFLRANTYGSRCSDKTFNAATNDGTPATYTGFNVNHFCGKIPTLDQLGRGIVSSNTSVTPPFLATIGIPNKLVDIIAGTTPELAANSAYLPGLLDKVPSLNGLGLKRDIIRLSADGQYEFENDISIGFMFGYNETNQLTAFDKDHTDVENLWAVEPTRYKDWSAEVRIASSPKSRFRWSLGASYSDISYMQQEYRWQIRNLITQPIQREAIINSTGGEDATVKGVFGSLEYDLLDNLTVTAEGRYQWDRSDVAPYLAAQGRPPAEKYSFNNFLPRAIIRWKASSSTTLYASYSKGVLPGQGNAQFLTATPFQQTEIQKQFPQVKDVTPAQELKNFEAGIKQRLFGGAFEYSLSAYYMQWRNIFASGIVQTDTSAIDKTPRVFNSIYIPGSADLWGVELDSSFRFTPKLTGRFTFAWQDNEYKEVFATSTSFARGYVRFDGNQIPRIPGVTSSLSLTYRSELNDDWDWYLRGDARYVGEAFEGEANTAKFNDYGRLNVKLGFAKDDVTVELFVNNLLDDSNWDFGYRSVSLSEPGFIFGPQPYQSGVIARAPDRRDIGLRIITKF